MCAAMGTEVSVRQNLRGGALAEFEEIYRSNVGLVAAYSRAGARARDSRIRTASMSEFEDSLWLEVVHEHGHELARAGRPVRAHRRATRPQLLAGTPVGVAAIATAAALLVGASTSPPAFAVTRNPDGTVTVSLKQRSGIAGANRKLAAMGCRRRSRRRLRPRRSLSARAA